MTELQRAQVATAFSAFARDARRAAVSDQDLAEWLLDVSARWLAAHGITRASIQQWIAFSLDRPRPAPLTAAARAPNEFGGSR